MTGEGKKLTQCISTVAAYYKEVYELCTTLNTLMMDELNKADLPCKVAGSLREQYGTDESGWLSVNLAGTVPLMAKRARKASPEMFLGYQVSLGEGGIAVAGNEEPLLHVCFWSSDLDLDRENGTYMWFPWGEDVPTFTLQENRLMHWQHEGDDWKSREWTFSLNLLTLDSSQALIDRVIRPAVALLKGESVMSALPDDLPGLFRYPSVEAINGPADLRAVA